MNEQKRKELNNFISEISSSMKYEPLDKISYDDSSNTILLDVNSNLTRKQRLTKKYHENLSVDNMTALINNGYFLGMTEQMVIDALGTPNKITEEKLKTKIKRTFTYLFPNNTVDKSLIFEKNKLMKYKVFQMYKS